MIKLTSINMSKYKSIVDSQYMKVEECVTTLVGMNESGKTAILETIAIKWTPLSRHGFYEIKWNCQEKLDTRLREFC